MKENLNVLLNFTKLYQNFNLMNNNIKVIVPFYNAKPFLETCVNSIMTQKYENFNHR